MQLPASKLQPRVYVPHLSHFNSVRKECVTLLTGVEAILFVISLIWKTGTSFVVISLVLVMQDNFVPMWRLID